MLAMQEEITRKRKVFYAKAKEGYRYSYKKTESLSLQQHHNHLTFFCNLNVNRQEIERITKVIDQCKEQGKGEMYLDILNRDLASEHEKLAELEANADKISIVEPPKEVRSFSSTTNPDGSVSIWNKSTSEIS